MSKEEQRTPKIIQTKAEKIALLFKNMEIQVDALASQTLAYDEKNDKFKYIETDVYGDSVSLRINIYNDIGQHLDQYELENVGELEFIEETLTLFESSNYDFDKLLVNIKEKYGSFYIRV